MEAWSGKKIVGIVRRKNPNLMVVTDDVYGVFVPGFRSLMAELPQNTITVYSFSKNFGCTGWRLGVIGVHQDNIYDKAIAKLPEAFKKRLDKRYGPLTLEPRKIKFIDRMVADSRCVALNHKSGGAYFASIFFAGMIVTVTPLAVGAVFARLVFRMNPLMAMGGLAGAQTCTPGLNALREASGSNIGGLAYTVPYTLNNILLTIWGPVVVAIVHAIRT